MLTDDVLQRMYDLAYCLHPDDGTALSVTLDACDRIILLRRMQDRREGHYKFRLPEACLPAVLCVPGVRRARTRPRMPTTQARSRGIGRARMITWYVTSSALIWWTMDRNACHVAVALGCFLYGYQPGDIAESGPRDL